MDMRSTQSSSVDSKVRSGNYTVGDGHLAKTCSLSRTRTNKESQELKIFCIRSSGGIQLDLEFL